MADETPVPDMDKILADAADSPRQGSVDGQEFQLHSIKDLIALDRYLCSKKAAKAGRFGIRFSRVDGGSVHD